MMEQTIAPEYAAADRPSVSACRSQKLRFRLRGLLLSSELANRFPMNSGCSILARMAEATFPRGVWLMRACLCDCHAPFGKIRSHFAAKRASVPIACPQAGAALPPPDESRPVGPVLGGKSIWDHFAANLHQIPYQGLWRWGRRISRRRRRRHRSV